MRNHLFWLSAVAATTAAFVLGVGYQHLDVLHNLQELISSDPYACYLQHKLYSVLKLIKYESEPKPLTDTSSRMQQIMKYGFPGLDDVRLYSDFVLSYDRRNRVAHWVYEHLLDENMAKNNETHVNRNVAKYQADMNVPSNFRAELMDYRKSGYDRGHLAAAGNHHYSQLDCNETFFLTNIAPQVGKGFNRDAWNKLEIYVRELTERYGSVYVCTGPLYLPKRQNSGKWYVEYDMIGPNMVAVPTHFFKVITVESKLPSGSPYMEAYVMPNEAIPDNVDIRQFLCDIREIEHGAGLQFFNGLRRSFFFASNYSTTPEIYLNFQ